MKVEDTETILNALNVESFDLDIDALIDAFRSCEAQLSVALLENEEMEEKSIIEAQNA